MGSGQGVNTAKILALPDYATSPLFDDRERLALEYADAITDSRQDVGDDLFARVRAAFSEEEIVELTTFIAWENCSSKFNRALRIPSQNLWQCRQDDSPHDER